ncbi:MAG: hypothetical protein NTX82_01660 [Candidatus Parcubacteria bacterium]|nr:hypothetical protein [Candidatus Parcubacteria bacterium]
MNPESQKTPEAQKREQMVVNEQALASMIDVPFENFLETIKHGNPKNPEIAKINKEATAEFDNFLDDLNQEMQAEEQEKPQASPENLKRIMNTVKRALERRKAEAAFAIAEANAGIKPGSPEAANMAAAQMAAWEDRASQLRRQKRPQ